MIFVDTSVWIHFFRVSNDRTTSHLKELLDNHSIALSVPVKHELLAGCSAHTFPQLQRTLSALPTFFPSQESWPLLERWIEIAIKKGEHFGIADLLIAAIAELNKGLLWSLDQDFQRMEKLKFIKIYRY